MNNPQITPNCNVIISRSSANDFLVNSKSELESITAKYYEIVTTSSRATGYTEDITLFDVLSSLSDTFCDATCILRFNSFFYTVKYKSLIRHRYYCRRNSFNC